MRVCIIGLRKIWNTDSYGRREYDQGEMCALKKKWVTVDIKNVVMEREIATLHIALICNTTASFDQVNITHEQPQPLSADSHVTIDTIHQTQDAVNVL